MATVQAAVARCLAQLSHELAGTLLYLDAGAAEAVATGVGAAALQGACQSGQQPTRLSPNALVTHPGCRTTKHSL